MARLGTKNSGDKPSPGLSAALSRPMAAPGGDTVVFRQDFCRDAEVHRATFCLSRRSGAALEAVVERILTPGEAARWGTLPSAVRRASYLLGRYCAKEAVAAQRGLGSLADIEVVAGVFEQPVVRGPGTQGVQVSLAHGGEWGVAVAFEEEFPMGIDLEPLDPERLQVVASQLTPAETRDWTAAAAAGVGSLVALGCLWTAKEALSKALRTGLMTPLAVLEVVRPQWGAEGLECEFAAFGQYRGISLPLGSHVVGMVFPKRFGTGRTLAELRAQIRGAPGFALSGLGR